MTHQPPIHEQALRDYWMIERRTLIMRLNYIDTKLIAIGALREPTVLSKEERQKRRTYHQPRAKNDLPS